MEPVGFAVGVVGLAGLFSVCLDAVERFDAWKKFDADLAFLGVRVEAERLRLKKWGKAVGIKSNAKLGGADGYDASRQHAALADERTAATVKKLLTLLQAICVGKDGVLFTGDTSGGPHKGQVTSNQFGISSTSRRARIKWALKDKATCMGQVEQIEVLVQKLHDLVPPHSAGVSTRTAAQAHQPAFDQLDGFLANQDEFRSMVLNIERSLKAEAVKELCSWLLGRHTPNEVYETALQRKLDNTCQWIFNRQEYLYWASPSFLKGSAKYLWINGPAAFGKTVLCATLVHHMRSVLKSPIACYFLSSDFESRRDPFVVIRSWLVQLSEEEMVFDLLRARWESSQSQVALTGDVIGAFKEALQVLPECTLVVDGLDECTSDENVHSKDGNFSVTDFLKTLSQIVSASQTRILVTSREDSVIRQGIMSNAQATEYKISPEDVRLDITEYSRDIVDKKLPGKDEKIREELCQKMAKRCGGQFLWIKLQGSNLRSWKNKKQLQAVIDKVPAGLEHLYERNWDRIQSLEPEESERVYAMLRWITFAVRPLSVAELTEALLIDLSCDAIRRDEMPDSLDDDYIDNEILRISASLLEVRKSVTDGNVSSQTVHFTHFSAKQYFIMRISEKMDTLMVNEKLRSSVEVACSNELAVKCLHYISMPRVWQSLDDDPHSIYRAFLNYAANAWYQHAAVSDHDAVVQNLNEFLTRKGPAWKSWRVWFDLQQAADDEPFEAVDEEPLYYAARFNLIETVKYLIQIGRCDVNKSTQRSGDTILQTASGYGHLEMAMVLLEAGADVLVPGNRGWTALHEAARLGHLQLLELLLENGAELDPVTSLGYTPLQLASFNGHADAVQLLLKHGADALIADNYGETALFDASLQGHFNIVKMLLETGAGVNDVSKELKTPLHCAAGGGHIEIVKFLLDLGANSDAFDNDNLRALEFAASEGHTKVVELLLNAGSELNVDEGTPSLLGACRGGHAEVARVLLAHGADAAYVSKDFTLLHVAVREEHASIVELLLAEGADVNSKVWPNDLSPLHIAAKQGRTDVARLLLAHGADAASLSEYGELPLHISVHYDNLSTFGLLLEEHASGVNVATSKGWMPIHYAAHLGRTEMMQSLIDFGADVSAADPEGYRPIHLAAKKDHDEALRVLMKNGVDISACSLDGWNPLLIASYKGYANIAKALLECDATAAGIDSVTTDGATPTIIAARSGHIEVVRVLLHFNANLEKANKYGWTALLSACCGHTDVTKLLLSVGAELTVKNAFGQTALHIAMMFGVSEIVEMLLNKGMDMALINQESLNPWFIAFVSNHNDMLRRLDAGLDFHVKNDEEETALHIAAGNGKVEAMRILLERGLTATAANVNGWTPLHIAALEGEVEAVKLLLEKGASPSRPSTSEGLTPMMTAILSGNLEVVQTLFYQDDGEISDNDLRETFLHYAARLGCLEITSDLLRRGYDITALGKNGKAALHGASSAGHLDIVRLCLDNGVEVEAKDRWGNSALLLASEKGHREVAEVCINAGAIVDTANEKGHTPLFFASMNGHVAVAKVLLERGATVEAVDAEYDTPLLRACEGGHIDIVVLLLANGAKINAKDRLGNSALLLAAENGHKEVIDVCLDAGAIVDAANEKGRTPLFFASMNGHVAVAEVLLERGATIDAVDMEYDTPLLRACKGGHVSVVVLLLANGAGIDVCNGVKETPLHAASSRGNAEIVKLLLERGGTLEARDREGDTPLSIAAFKTNESIVRLLLDAGADYETRDNGGRTPLFLAANSDCGSIIRMLLDAGADMEARDDGGSTPLSVGSYRGHVDAVTLLLQNGADTEATNTDKRTPLMFAALEGKSAVVELLLENRDGTRRACPDSRDMYGQTALSFAVRMRHQDIVNMLLASGTANLLSDDEFGRSPVSWAKVLGCANMDDFFSLETSEQAGDSTGAKSEEWGKEACENADSNGSVYRDLMCDVCRLLIPKSMGMRACAACHANYNFDICDACYDIGARCHNQEHIFTETPPEGIE
ncbi:hypothetical protein PWT90_06473 [Aphanocladium album]|nr:hypothetical protein PWT90_06473 [Aphanocladium album]